MRIYCTCPTLVSFCFFFRILTSAIIYNDPIQENQKVAELQIKVLYNDPLAQSGFSKATMTIDLATTATTSTSTSTGGGGAEVSMSSCLSFIECFGYVYLQCYYKIVITRNFFFSIDISQLEGLYSVLTIIFATGTTSFLLLIFIFICKFTRKCHANFLYFFV